MTEAEWLACTDPEEMLEFLRGKASDRKLRLFAAAFCQTPYFSLKDRRYWKAIQIAEQMADNEINESDLQKARQAVHKAWEVSFRKVDESFRRGGVEYRETKKWKKRESVLISGMIILGDAWDAAESICRSNWADKYVGEARHAIAFLCDLFGQVPFRPVSLDTAWLTWHGGLLVTMARQMYESRDFTDMPVLADALEEAGCSDQDILSHCRGPGPHVRGCWVVDTILGKT